MARITVIETHLAELARWAEEARSELARCLARGDTAQAETWAAKVRTFEERAAWWEQNARTWRKENA